MAICYPWFHLYFAPLAAGPQTYVRSGCGVGADGNIQCSPESMRKSAEAQLQAKGLFQDGLSLETYTLSRYMQSEVGSGTVEARVAVGEAAVNRAKLERLGQGIVSLLLYRQPSKLYGAINVEGVKTGRWASTSADPTVLNLILADLVLSGESGNFNQGADDQDGLEYQRYFPVPMNRILSEARNGKYWVGPLPGIDHWHTAQFRTYGYSPNSIAGKALIERARQVFGNPQWDAKGKIVQALRPDWPSNLPICGKPASKAKLFFLAAIGLAAGAVAASLVARRYLHPAT